MLGPAAESTVRPCGATRAKARRRQGSWLRRFHPCHYAASKNPEVDDSAVLVLDKHRITDQQTCQLKGPNNSNVSCMFKDSTSSTTLLVR